MRPAHVLDAVEVVPLSSLPTQDYRRWDTGVPEDDAGRGGPERRGREVEEVMIILTVASVILLGVAIGIDLRTVRGYRRQVKDLQDLLIRTSREAERYRDMYYRTAEGKEVKAGVEFLNRAMEAALFSGNPQFTPTGLTAGLVSNPRKPEVKRRKARKGKKR